MTIFFILLIFDISRFFFMKTMYPEMFTTPAAENSTSNTTTINETLSENETLGNTTG